MTEFMTDNQTLLIVAAGVNLSTLVFGFILGRKSKKSISLAPVIKELKNIVSALKEQKP